MTATVDSARTAQDCDNLVAFLRSAVQRGPVLLLTGAGISTASGIGDYRDSDGQYKRPPPVTITQFLDKHQSRQRYWARSLFGWPAFSSARPNAAHHALAALQSLGFTDRLITQNVDGLHQSAGHREVMELHGNLKGVECVVCGAQTAREQLQVWLRDHNQHLLGARAHLGADGDADLGIDDFSEVAVPECPQCGGVVKPTVVFFGDSVPKAQVERAYGWVAEASALLIVGSSVMIHSSFRFARRARELGLPLAAINLGRTRADEWLDLKMTSPCETLLPAVVARLAGTNGIDGHPNI